MMTDTGDTPAYIRFHWAKSDRQDPRHIHLLEHHLADVGACFEALLSQPTIRGRLARSGGWDSLDEATSARLAVFAALHDIGKANVGFQTRIWREEDLGGRRKPRWAGHTSDLAPVLTGEDRATVDWFFAALGWDDLLTWDDRDGETVCAMLVATLSHHGRPLKLEGGPSENPAAWRRFNDLNPEECVRRIGELLRQWFRSAFVSDAPPLPSAPAFQHMFLGLCNWADWIGSNERWFPYVDMPRNDYIETARRQAKIAVNAIGLDLSTQRDGFESVPEFGELFDIPGLPNAIQEAAHDTPPEEQLVIIESETGSGKTEAALWRFAHMHKAGLVDGLYFALPTRSAAVQIHERVGRFTSRLFSGQGPPVVRAVPGYEPGADASSVAMQDYKPWWEDHHDDDKPWASRSPKRYLAAQIAVGTVDQAMMGALQVKNAHMRSACLARNLLVVDEVHASDTYMSVVLEALLDAHVGAGGYALLMSATLGSAARRRWLHHGRRADQSPPTLREAIDTPYPAVSTPSADGENLMPAGENDREKQVSVEASPTMHDFADVAQRALAAAGAGAKVLVVRNTVGHAVSTQQVLEELAAPDDAELLFTVDSVTTLHHGRFAACDRAMLDRRIEELLSKGRPSGGRVVVGTQTLEQSLDIDADLLVTDLCPVDVLLQRIGRLHRHNSNDPDRPADYAKPACVVLTPPDSDLTPLLESGRDDANGLGPRGGVYGSLSILEATRRLIGEYREWRIPEMNRLLVEGATHPKRLEAITDEMGDRWREHAIQSEGGEIADGQFARGHTIKRDKSFLADNREVLFVSSEERIRTRLGDDRIDICFDPPQRSPFDGSSRVERLAVSVRWLPDGDTPKSVEPALIDGGFEFSVGDRTFRYDRLGLRRI